MVAYAFLFCSKKNDAQFQTRSSWSFNLDLFKRMIRFGAPSGAHFFLDLTGFTIFILLVGRIGVVEQAASNIVLSINLLSLLPMIGLGTATSIMVGQFQGAKESHLANRTTVSALHMAFVHNTVIALLYWFIPDILISPFITETFRAQLPELEATTIQLLRFFIVIIYLDSAIIMTGGTLKGSGDTRFVMAALAATSIFCLVLPSYILIEVLNQPVHVAWFSAVANLSVVCLLFVARYRSGKWKGIEVIDHGDSAK